MSDSHLPCYAHVMLRPCRSSQGHTTEHGRRETVMLCRGLEKNGMVGAWHGHGMASVNQTWPHCVNQMGKTHSKSLAARHGRGTAWERYAMCESTLRDDWSSPLLQGLYPLPRLRSRQSPRNLRLAHSLPLVDALLTSNWFLEKRRDQRLFQANVRTKTITPVFTGMKSVIAVGSEYF